MEIRKVLIFRNKSGRVSSVRKKLAVLFIFACMAVNGFVPSTVEISKYSLVMLAAATAQSMMESLFQKCNAPLEVVASKVCAEIREFLFGFSAEGTSGKREAGKTPDNTADNHTTVVEQITINESRRIAVDVKEDLYSTFVYVVEKLFMLYHQIKIPDDALRTVLVLAFVMFIIGIRQRKSAGEEEAEITLNINIGKTRISA